MLFSREYHFDLIALEISSYKNSSVVSLKERLQGENGSWRLAQELFDFMSKSFYF